LSPAALAQVIARGAAPVVSPIPASVGAAGLSTTILHNVNFAGSTNGSPLAMPSLPGAVTLNPATQAKGSAVSAVAYEQAAPMARTAAPAALGAVDRHPVLGMISEIQKAGGDALLTQLDAAKSPSDFEAVAMALPQGAARASIQSFAKALAAQNFGAGSDSIGALYDNARREDMRPSAVAPKAEGFWAQVAGWHMPRPLSALRRYALKKAEESRPQAKLVDLDSLKVPAERLRWTPDAAALPERASKVERGARKVVGLKIEDAGYNVIVTGAEGTGRETAVREILKEIAPTRPTPGDVVAAVNFANTENPVVLTMPAGEGKGFVEAVSDAVERIPQMMAEALSKGPVAKARKQVQAQLQANVADREKAFQREAARVTVAGGFNIEVGAQQTDETHIGIVSALTKNGVRVKPEELDKALEGTGVTKDQVMADFQAKARPLIEKYGQILQTNMQEQAQAQMQLQMLEQKVAGNVISEAVGPLANLAGGAAEREEDAGHVAWRESAKARMDAWQAKVDAVRVAGLFSVSIGQGITLLFKGEAVSQKSFEALKAAGDVPAALTWEAVVQQAIAAVQPLAGEAQQMQEAIEAEHQKLHESDPPIGGARRMAVGWVQAFAQDLMANWRGLMPQVKAETGMDLSERYNVSSVVDNDGQKGAPVVFEHSPSFNKLFGYAEDNQKVMMTPGGAMMKKEAPGGPTLKGGSFLKASGGYLVLNLIDVLREPGVYPTLMRQVRNGRAEIVDGGIAGLMTGKPSSSYAVPASVKVVFVGSPYLKMLLSHNDEDFGRLFHAVAEFDNSFKIAADTIAGYLRFMRDMVTHSTGKMLDFGRDAIAGILETAAGMAESNEKLTAQFGAVATLMQEASFWPARRAGTWSPERTWTRPSPSARSARGPRAGA
ncbi:MAG: Peptidase S16 lon domain protein, partial [Elusimicrobia bacterium]